MSFSHCYLHCVCGLFPLSYLNLHLSYCPPLVHNRQVIVVSDMMLRVEFITEFSNIDEEVVSFDLSSFHGRHVEILITIFRYCKQS